MQSRERVSISMSRLLLQWPGVRKLSTGIAHLVGSPTLHQIYLHSELLTTCPEEAAEAIVGERVHYEPEYAQVRKSIAEQFSHAHRRFPEYYVVEEGTAYLLYMLVRHMSPSLVLEVGVADGRSTQVILSALDANDKGRLVSVDINSAVGSAAGGHPRWQLVIRSPGASSSRELRDLLAYIGPPDLFLHDAMHTYPDQYADYVVAWDHMCAGSLFMSDDVDQSWAFIDMTKSLGLKPVVLTDRRKAVGAVLRPPSVAPSVSPDARP
jgi:predicted O-methyltransferase YrrM